MYHSNIAWSNTQRPLYPPIWDKENSFPLNDPRVSTVDYDNTKLPISPCQESQPKESRKMVVVVTNTQLMLDKQCVLNLMINAHKHLMYSTSHPKGIQLLMLTITRGWTSYEILESKKVLPRRQGDGGGGHYNTTVEITTSCAAFKVHIFIINLNSQLAL